MYNNFLGYKTVFSNFKNSYFIHIFIGVFKFILSQFIIDSLRSFEVISRGPHIGYYKIVSACDVLGLDTDDIGMYFSVCFFIIPTLVTWRFSIVLSNPKEHYPAPAQLILTI